MDDIDPGTSTLTFEVAEGDTAVALGSGDLPVLGTPRLLAWVEAATCAAAASLVRDEETSVGTRVTLEHRGPSGVGERIRVTASVVHRDGRLLRFEVAAIDSVDVVVGHGEVTRVVVNRDRFMARVRR